MDGLSLFSYVVLRVARGCKAKNKKIHTISILMIVINKTHIQTNAINDFLKMKIKNKKIEFNFFLLHPNIIYANINSVTYCCCCCWFPCCCPCCCWGRTVLWSLVIFCCVCWGGLRLSKKQMHNKSVNII